MNIYLRLLNYLAPSKSRIVVVFFVSILTSLFSVISIYSVLPLLNTVFTSNQPQQTSASAPGVKLPNMPELQNAKTQAMPVDADVKFPEKLTDTKALKTWATAKFQQLFDAGSREETLLRICLFLIGAFFLKNLFIYLNGQLIFRIQTRTAKTLRDDVFSSIVEMQIDYFNQNRVGTLMNYVHNEVSSVNNMISSTFVNLLQNPFSILVYVVVLLVLSWKLTLFASVTSLLIFAIMRLIGKRIKSMARRLRDLMGNMNSVLQEKFSGIKVIKSSAFEDVEVRRFKQFTRDYRKLDIRINRLKNIISPLNETFLIGAVAMVLWYGGLQVFAGKMTSTELLLFAFTLYSVMGPFKTFSTMSTQIHIGMASAEKLFELLDTRPDIVNGTRKIDGFSHSIRFEEVSFRYRKEPDAPFVLDKVSFEIKKGEMVALVGQSGSGKSTAVDLLLRFYDVNSGRITIDGIDIKEYDYKQLRQIIGVVSQEVILFNDTIEQNIAYGIRNGIDPEQIERAARLANAHNFIIEKPEGYKTLVGDRGIQLSGGQRQRLAIARAMVRNPELLIFDEATSALDNESEKVVQEAIDHAMENRTALVVAHRLSTVRNADRIIVMERGRVIESGSHEALLEMNGTYKHLYDIQFSEKSGDKPGY
ncbi:ABC transporter ATP-binding protein [Chlorobaculum sp. 24CR]|uniref:ABC transporter ATP-binding protein n=1 Tax=Chlorobaculum sp. 24CR TaxID=2508878 RepID=UPI00100B4300|nr:ABC transporter ATP-binding protein [Chlorobaculum sp. 24CR]RXK81079.1 ABC transporter ATP-binding protein [Chlorobaculum sp. 24CR]